jgi:L-ribulose-5-phosphate 3-epimerase
MLWGFNTNGFAHHRLEDTIAILAELGFGSVAITLDYNALDPYDRHLRRKLVAVRNLLHGRGLHSVVETGARFLLDPWRKHRPTLLDPPRQAQLRFDFLQKAVDIAKALGSDAVSFWSGAAPAGTRAELLSRRLVRACRKLADYAADRGVRLAFEPEPGMFVAVMEHFAELHERVDHPAFGLTLDIGHLHCLGEVPISAHLEKWRAWLWNIHIEDMCRGVHDHLPFGEGEIDFGPVFRSLHAIEYTGGVHVELSRHSHDAVETARRSLAFLLRHGADRKDEGG